MSNDTKKETCPFCGSEKVTPQSWKQGARKCWGCRETYILTLPNQTGVSAGSEVTEEDLKSHEARMTVLNMFAEKTPDDMPLEESMAFVTSVDEMLEVSAVAIRKECAAEIERLKAENAALRGEVPSLTLIYGKEPESFSNSDLTARFDLVCRAIDGLNQRKKAIQREQIRRDQAGTYDMAATPEGTDER